MIPLSLYIHIPWCERKCPYCDFNSHVSDQALPESRYIDALLRDLDADLAYFAAYLSGRSLLSIFIGGGTPSLFSADGIKSLLQGVDARLPIEKHTEITLEANPGSAERARFDGYRAAGVNRLSIGVQSFNDQHLAALGRIHDKQAALAAVDAARRAGFDNLNLDLMFGLPAQSQQQAEADLAQAIDLGPTHISSYQLTLEPNTWFFNHPPALPSHDRLWAMQESLQSQLKDAGYGQYEVSAFAQAEQQCKHNLNYWQFGDYLGIGAGAHSKISSSKAPEPQQVMRSWKFKHPRSYLEKADQAAELAGQRTAVDIAQLPFEFMLNALRLHQGFALELYTERTFQAPDNLHKIIDKHREAGLLDLTAGHLQPTQLGRKFIDSMLQDYLP